VKLCHDAPKLRLESARFSGSEFGRDDERLEAVESFSDRFQTPLAVGGESRAAWVGVGLGSQQADGVIQERAPFRSARDTVGGQQGEGLCVLEGRPLDRVEKLVLFVGPESTQRMSKGWADASPGKRALHEGGQSCCDIRSPCHPLRLALEKPCDGGGAHALLVS
jgi:hypothetical protein